MPGMRLCCGFQLRQQQRLRLSQGQKLDLQLLLSLELAHPEYPNTVKGFPGMLAAHEILRRRDACGILVGGLSEAIWNRRRKPEELAKHKDVDVLIVDQQFKPEEPFDGGIDWWLPRREQISYGSDVASVTMTQTWYENGNGVTLNFGLKAPNLSCPGLYILDPDLVVEMRMAEVEASTASAVLVDDDVYESYKRLVRRRMKTQLPSFLARRFNHSAPSDVTVETFSHDMVNAIRKASA